MVVRSDAERRPAIPCHYRQLMADGTLEFHIECYRDGNTIRKCHSGNCCLR